MLKDLSLSSANFEILSRLDTPTLSDALDLLHLPTGIGGFIQFGSQRRIIGPARTVQLVLDDGYPRKQHLGSKAIETADPGCVIVVEHHSRNDAAGWGGLLTAAAIEVGVNGVVVDGSCRDIDDYVALDFPVQARRAVPATARTRVVESNTGKSVSIGGLIVNPDDWIVADRSGLVVIPAHQLENTIKSALYIQNRETLMVADLRRGIKVSEVLGRQYETMLDALITDAKTDENG